MSNSPGAMVHTRIPTFIKSRATGRAREAMAPLEAAYAACPIWPSEAATLDVLIMTPEIVEVGREEGGGRREGRR